MADQVPRDCPRDRPGERSNRSVSLKAAAMASCHRGEPGRVPACAPCQRPGRHGPGSLTSHRGRRARGHDGRPGFPRSEGKSAAGQVLEYCSYNEDGPRCCADIEELTTENMADLSIEHGRSAAEGLRPVEPARRTTRHGESRISERTIEHAGAVRAAGRPEVHRLSGVWELCDVFRPL